MRLESGDVVTVDHLHGVYVVNVVMVGGEEVSVSRMFDRPTRRLAGHRDWTYVSVRSCHPTGQKVCGVHRSQFPCGGCAYLASRKGA